MSWYSKVVWSEGLFLRQQHFQQSDRYFEHLLEGRVGHLAPYPWGFSALEVDRDLAQQNKFGLRRASGVMQDGLPFDMPATSPLPAPIDVPENAERQYVWLTMPAATPSSREVAMPEAGSGRYARDIETVVDSASNLHAEEELEVAHPRLALDIRSAPRQGYHCLKIARITEVRDKTVLLEESFAPPVLSTLAHPVATGWIERVLGWVQTKLEALARYAADPSSGGGLQAFDYYMLQLLNREINRLRHLRHSRYVHPEQLYVALVALAGELATFSTGRLAQVYPPYDHDALRETFEPVLSDIQHFLSLDIGRAIRLNLAQIRQNAFRAAVTDRNLFRNANFFLEVTAARPLTDIQIHFPSQCKVGPDTKMRQIVEAHLPGVELVHVPTPPRQIRAVSGNVYFYLDKATPLWPEFSVATGIGIHISGEWGQLGLELWAIMDDRR